MIGRLKEAVEYYNQLGEVHEIHLKTLLNFADSAIESEGKWPGKMDENSPSALAVRRMGYVGRSEGFNEAIDLCLAAHAFEKARWREKLLTEEEMLQASAQGYCVKTNENKEIDAELLSAITQAIHAVQQKKAEGKYA
jgi:hypothetical protein